MRGFAKLVAGGRAVASSNSSLLRPSLPIAALPRTTFARPSSAASSSSSFLPSRRTYASPPHKTTTTLLEQLEAEIDEQPEVSAEVLRQDESESRKASKASAAETASGEPTPAAVPQESREAVLKRLAKQEFKPEMWRVGAHKSLTERRRVVTQDGAADECRWKTDPFNQSVWKLNLVARLIRRLPVDEALIQLKFSEKRSAVRLYTSLLDGKRRAIEKGLNEERLIVDEAWTEKALTMKRRNIMGRGRTGIIQKKASRVYFVLKEDKPYVEKLDEKHQIELRKVRLQGPNAHVHINRRKVKVEGASTASWRW